MLFSSSPHLYQRHFSSLRSAIPLPRFQNSNLPLPGACRPYTPARTPEIFHRRAILGRTT
jgi:hypothetical protein